ncbi:MAG TPA: c-type cytochrome [Puia sp.]|jgi:mono/diheme cytochrome c family protein|nr:c-type cytochrome [Puia sp.]
MKEEFIRKSAFHFKSLVIILALPVFVFVFFQSFAQSTPWAAPKDADNVKNPLAGNAGVIAEAKTLYVANCGPCHGEKGKGDGPASQGLNPRPADHTSAAVQGQTDGAIFWKLTEGRTPMPGYKKIFSDQQRWELVNFIRTLAKGGKKK